MRALRVPPLEGLLTIYNMHPNERRQAALGKEFARNPPPNTRVHEFNHPAALKGARYLCCNPAFVDLDKLEEWQHHRCNERTLLKGLLDFIGQQNFKAVVDLHDGVTPQVGSSDYDSAIVINRHPKEPIAELANYLVAQGVPVIEAPRTFLAGKLREAALLDMSPGDPRFSRAKVRKLLGQVATGTVPAAPPVAVTYKFQGDVTVQACEDAGIDTTVYRAPFTPIEPEQARALRLHPNTHFMSIGSHPVYYAVALTPCEDARSVRSPMHGVVYDERHECYLPDTRVLQSA